MKPLAELDHYEVLEIPRDAPEADIERAYRLLRSAYAEDSVAAYSLLEGPDAEALRERVETAYRVLSDPESRQMYDASLKSEAPAQGQTGFVFERGRGPAPAPPPFEGLEDEGEGDDVWDGARLRRARVRRGAELEEISRVTKINTTYLRGLEEERFEDLPAAVYVRGFVTAVARHLRLDAPRVAASYMQRYEAKHGSRRRGRLFARLGP